MRKITLNDLFVLCYSVIPFLVQVVLALLKMSGVINWAWGIILIPLWLYVASFGGAVVYFYIDLIVKEYKN